MGSASRLLCTLLALLLAFAGGVIDLCACDAGSHGAFCADAGESAVASCHGEPAVVEKHGCCGGGPAPATDEALTAAGCGCPVLVLEQPPSESPVPVVGFDRTSDAGLAIAALPVSWVAPAGDFPADEPWRRPPRVPALRRHLELHVLRH